ncbi:LuxE/PaaK family acyltransferase [Mesohalobacter halotolerans]|uniref:Acyl transferase n=1 Tax=Mesohalobacter halotolerans TaxID=1883405 RepID=A0A4U5TR13_9FLAO|nr:acyl transferase [Mesohalobacter halotolerans]MBS3737951.1 acyl transferase [Psychroflexus sp.]TKS56201.1 acyl transferase [Mesohalobacter halotolerans]
MKSLNSKILKSLDDKTFNELSLEVFSYQYENCSVYRQFCELLKKSPQNVNEPEAIPFLPIEFFKSHKILSSQKPVQKSFTSSGTTGSQTSKHHITDLRLYEDNSTRIFEKFYGPVEDYCILALLPSYLERDGSSLVYMVDHFIKKSNNSESGFYLNNHEKLYRKLISLENKSQKTLLIGVSFGLLDFIEKYKLNLNHTIVMETGGMKGRRKEMIREDLHDRLKKGFGVRSIHSEYGMTELLSQAYSKGAGIFDLPDTMKILIRDPEDPLMLFSKYNKTGGINVIDLCNMNSCSFIATQDLGQKTNDNTLKILGRFDHSDIRGCNLLTLN